MEVNGFGDPLRAMESGLRTQSQARVSAIARSNAISGRLAPVSQSVRYMIFQAKTGSS